MKQYLLLFFKGMAMGAADVVPGVSGGTVAFITGIYAELIDSLRSLTPAALLVWYRSGFVAFWRHINGTFLTVLFSGVLLSLLSLANVVTYCLEHHPLLVWGFFFGVVLASSLYMGRQLPMRKISIWFIFVLGVLVALGVSVAKPVQLPGEWWMAFIAGAIAICAMILPGISGSFLLLLMGMYSYILSAVTDFNLFILGCFVAGCVVGLLLFSHVLSWLLHRYQAGTLAALTGFLLGSLNIVWPWKHTLLSVIDRHGKTIPLLQENLLPGSYRFLVGNDPQTIWVLGLALLGLLLVFGLEYVAHWGETTDAK
jgi:putative membrane protein